MTRDTHQTGAPWRNFHGRLKGKALNKAQQDYLDQDLAALSPGAVDWQSNPTRSPIDMASRFGDRPVWLEIGFGGGEHLVRMAGRYPEVQIIGCEPYINGVAMLLGKIRRLGTGNVAVHPGDVRDLFDVLPAASVARAFLLYPDPWPKKRHHKRRFVTPGHLEPLARVLAPGALFRVATDIPDYVRQTLEEVPACGFALVEHETGAENCPWPDWTRTRYEAKALREGRVPQYLTFRRLGA